MTDEVLKTVPPVDASDAPETPDPDRKQAIAQKRLERAAKKEKDRLWHEYVRGRKERLESEKRMICQPDKATFTKGKTVRGYISRIAVIIFAVFGVSFLLCNAFAIGEGAEGLSPGWRLFLCSALFTTLVSLTQILKPRAVVIPAGTLITIGVFILFFLPDPFVRMYESAIAGYNSALDHLTKVGFYAASQNRIDYAYTTGSESELALRALIAVAFIYSSVYALSLAKRTNIPKLVPAVLLSVATPALVFIYNISRSNWSVSITAAAFAAILTLAGYDIIFSKRKKSKKTTSAYLLYPESDDVLPAAERRRLRKERRLAKAAARREARADKKRVKTVDEEITDYFAEKPKRAGKKQKRKLSREEKAAAAAEKQQKRRERREERKKEREARDRVFTRRRTSAAGGGFAALTVFLISFLLMLIPSLLTERPFTTFKALDDKFELIRTYVTAVLMGDDPVLDVLTFEHEGGNFNPRSTDPTPRHYKGTELWKVYSNGRQNVYLRGWIATDYDTETGCWTTVSPGSELLEEYRYLFGTTIDPSETLMYGFHTLYDHTLIPPEDELNYIKRSKTNTSLGFVVTQVSVLPVEKPSSKLVLMPVYNLRSMNYRGELSSGKSALFLRGFGGEGSSGLTYSNWFDGIYSSYRYSLPNDGFSVVAMVPTMKNSGYYRTVSDRIAAVNLALLEIGDDSFLDPYATYVDSDGTRKLLNYVTEYRLNDKGEPEVAISVFYSEQPFKGGTEFAYDSEMRIVQTVDYTVDGKGKVTSSNRTYLREDLTGEDAPYVPVPDLPIAVKYKALKDNGLGYDAEFDQYANVLNYYTPFVYDHYAARPGIPSITDLLEEIKSKATRTDYEEYEEYDEETNETYILTRRITVPADFSLAAQSNGYKKLTEKDGSYKYRLVSAVLDREVYRQRHELVMEIVNYLADEEKFTYTLTPEQTADESLTGIEKFLDGNRQGYCVQFATTLALLLREAGIPARYVDGYIAQSLVPSNGEAVETYAATVRDRNAHAWVEVWYDGIGWIPYEATPPYYDGMYESSNSGGGSTIRPTPGGDDDEPDEPDDPGLTPEELARLEEERRKEELRLLIRKIVTVTLISLAVAALIAVAIFLIAIRARKADKRREELMARLEASTKKDAPEADRKDVRALTDLIFLLLRVCRLYPKNGEFTDEFCERLSDSAAPALMAGAKDPKLENLQPLSRPDVRRAFSAVAAEEFGFGCEKRDLPLLITLYRRLHGFEYKRHTSLFRRLKIHYINNSL